MKRLRWAGWTYALHLLTLFGIALSNGFLILTVLFAGSAALTSRVKDWPWRRLRPLYLPLGLYVLLLGSAVVASPEPRQSARGLSEILSLMTLAAGPLLVRGERAGRKLADALVASGALLALYGLAQTFAGYGDLERRIRGPFSHWMTFSGVLLLCDLLLIARLSVDPASRRIWPWPWRWAALAAINLALVGSLTRNAWLALGITLVIFFGARRPRLLLWLPPAAVLFVLLAPLPVLSRVTSITNLHDPSNYDRLCMADAGRRMIAENPVFGIGPDLMPYRYGLYRHPTAPRYWVPHLHNTFLELAAERGLPSLLAYLWLMAASAGLAMHRYRQEGGDAGSRADLYLGSILGLFAFNLAGLFEYNWGDVEVQRVALFLLALPFCLEARADPDSPPP